MDKASDRGFWFERGIFIPPSFVSLIAFFFLQITGTARGNGRELALQFHRLGAKIVCVDKDETGNDETVRMIKGEGGQAIGFTVDIRDKDRLKTMHEAVKRQMGPVDILVNNAAVVETTSFVNPKADDVIPEIVNTNLLGQIWVRVHRFDVTRGKKERGISGVLSALGLMISKIGDQNRLVPK